MERLVKCRKLSYSLHGPREDMYREYRLIFPFASFVVKREREQDSTVSHLSVLVGGLYIRYRTKHHV